ARVRRGERPLPAPLLLRRVRPLRRARRALRARVAQRAEPTRPARRPARLLQGVRAVLTGNEALARALGAARVRRVWSHPGPPLARLQGLLDAQKGGPSHRHAVNEQVATSLALGGALLTGQNTCVLLRQTGVEVALEALSTFGVANELLSACLIVE